MQQDNMQTVQRNGGKSGTYHKSLQKRKKDQDSEKSQHSCFEENTCGKVGKKQQAP